MPRPGRPSASLILTSRERDALERWSRRRTIGAVSVRSRMILACGEGLANTAVAERFEVTAQTVGKWRRRFIRRRLDGLTDEPRPGAPRKVTDDIAARIVARTLEGSPLNAPRWSTRSMAQASGLSQRTIARIWMAHGLRLRRRRGQKPVIEMVGRIVRLPKQREWGSPRAG